MYIAEDIVNLIRSGNNLERKARNEVEREIGVETEKAQKAKDYTKNLHQDCKSCGGPCTSVDELHHILFGKDTQMRILKMEMVYMHTHKADKIPHKELFRFNGLSYAQMLDNLSILLDDEDMSAQ